MNLLCTLYLILCTKKTAIHPTEWEKLAKALDTTVDEIFEPQNGISFVNNDDSKSNNCVGSQNNYFNIPEYILNSLQKYIEKLEKEIEGLKSKSDL